MITKRSLTVFLILGLLIIDPFFTFGQKEKPRFVNNEIIVRMIANQSPYEICRKMPYNYHLKVAKELSKYADIWLLQFDKGVIDVETMIKEVLLFPTVQYAQPNHFAELRVAPNDPEYGNQWQHQKINSEGAWSITTGGTTNQGTEIVVALIESADLLGHEDLSANQWKNTNEIPNNGIDDDNNGYIDDYDGWNVTSNDDNIGTGSHGTSCAGMIGAVGDNGIGVSGVNWDIKIMCVAGHDNPFTEANIVSSYDYALNARLLWNQTQGAEGAFVVATSSSWGIDGGDPADYPIWCSFYDDLGQAGILNVGATTNQHQDVDVVGDMPTTCASNYMIGVTATNQNDIIDFAGWGDQNIEVAAPGSSIYTTQHNDGYGSTSGTSFACPLTAGLIGLMYSAPCDNIENYALNDPQGMADLVKNALMDGVDKTAYLADKVISGGRINAKQSIDTLMAMVCNSCIPPSGLQISVIDSTVADLTFNSVSDTSSYVIYLQLYGSNNWQVFPTSDTIFTFTNLSLCSKYEYYVTSSCGGSITSAHQFFLTTGCGNCIDLNYCNTQGNNPSALFKILSPNVISGTYNFVPTDNFGANVDSMYAYGTLVLVNDGSAFPNVGCNTLSNAAAINGNIAVIKRGSCSFTDKVLNAQNAGAVAAIIINNVATSPIVMGGVDNSITIPAVMISQADGNTIINAILNNEQPTALLGRQKEWIANFKIDGNTYVTGDNNGYLLNTSGINLVRNESYNFELIPGYDGESLPEFTRIWIDINQNGTFETTELIFDQGTSYLGTVNGSIQIPTASILGKTRMRVQMAFQTENSVLPSVCGDFIAGEVEDYCVTITDEVTNTIQSEKTRSSILVYPNPAKDQLTIKMQGLKADKMLIYTATGKLIKEVSLSSITQINSADWANGIYILYVIDKRNVLIETQKVSIHH